MQTKLNRATVLCVKDILKRGGRILDFTTVIILFDSTGSKLCELTESNLLQICQEISLNAFQVENGTQYTLAE